MVISSLGEQLREVMSTARLKSNAGEAQQLEKLIIEFQYIYTVMSDESSTAIEFTTVSAPSMCIQ
jgi:hypothetical protein